MTNCNQEILKALFKTKDLLSDEASKEIKLFVISQKYETGGFTDRAGKPDIYYSVFGYTLTLVYDIDIELDKEFAFLESWSENRDIDLIHAVCYLRCYFLLLVIEQKQKFGLKVDPSKLDGFFGKLVLKGLIKRLRKDCQLYFDLIENYQSKDGGYNHNEKQAKQATVYASFLVWTFFQDLNEKESILSHITDQLESLRCEDGSFANDNSSSTGVSSASAAGLIMAGGRGIDSERTIAYLKQNYTSRGGFKAATELPIADVLSTSTALLALYMSGENLQDLSEKSIDFINLHWDESGGFFGSIADMTCDVEYTYYALFGIGILI